MELYINLKGEAEIAIKRVKRDLNILSFLRFFTIISALFSGYYYYKTDNENYIYSSLFFFVCFLILLRYYDKKANEKRLKDAIVSINEDEISFLKNEKNPFETGVEFQDLNHEYAHDLDIFGYKSLYQNLNRTHTFIGKKTLATALLERISNNQIIENQEAVKELSAKINWRQQYMSFAKVSNDKEEYYKKLIVWSKYNSEKISKLSKVASFILPILFIGCFVTYRITNSSVFLNYTVFSFVINLLFAVSFFKRVKLENAESTAIDKIIKQYGLMLDSIERESFTSKKLIELQNELKVEQNKASHSLITLSKLFSILDSVANPVAAILLNGCFLYHIHNLNAIIRWKSKNAMHLERWLAIIGEFEKLNSIANFSYNNPQFAFPELNEKYEISFSEIAHPLLDTNNRVTNTVDFQPQSFMILTGSNMSGKSTFLRSLGVNMVLAAMGAPVCATKANVHPMPILVSMRLSDSLSDNESYFYAEIKRLKKIMDALENERSFVLLDEILRGTNSDDKRSGTVDVIKKMIAKNGVGAIATHDIEVCLIASDYPQQLVNKCFEVEINQDDLHFDYKLRNGICKNKSATFLMKKIGVI